MALPECKLFRLSSLENGTGENLDNRIYMYYNNYDWKYPLQGYNNTSNVRITSSVFLALTVVVAIPCNILVIVNIIKKHLFRQPTILQFFNLLIVSMLFCIIHIIPFGLVTSIAGEFVLGSTDFIRCIVCSVDGFILIFLSIEMISSFLLISVDRFLYLFKPLRHSSIVTVKRTIIAILLTWIHALAFSIPPLFGFGGFKLAGTLLPVCVPYSVNRGGKISRYWWLLIFSVLLPFFLLGVTTNGSSFFIILRNLRKNHHRLKIWSTARTNADERYSSIYRQQIILFQMFGSLLIANILIYIPVIAYVITIVNNGRDYLEFLTFVHIAFNSQAVVHPVLQVLFLKEIRNTLKRICCSLKVTKLPSVKCCGCSCLEACKAAVIPREAEAQTAEEGQVVAA